jgi:hypothetical protein
MLQLQTQQGFQGFGSGGQPGECYFAVNMTPTPFGFAPFLKNVTDQFSGPLTTLTLIRSFAEEAGIPWVFEPNYVYSRASGSFQLEHHFTDVDSSGNGLILDPTLRMLAVHDRYLSKKDGPGTGSSWTEQWQDLGSAVTGDKVMDTFEDWVVIPHGNGASLLNVTDDSFQVNAITFPAGCTCFIAKSNGHGILLGCNMGNRSFVGLWDAQAAGTIADWIWFDSPLKSICRSGSKGQNAYSGNESEWIVTTTREIVLTDGYTKSTLATMPDALLGDVVYNPIGAGTMADNQKFYLNHTPSTANYARRQAGLYVLDMGSNLWSYIPPSDNCQQEVNMGAIFQDSSSRIWLGHQNVASGVNYISQLTSAVPASASIVSAPFGLAATKKIAEGAKVELVSNSQFVGGGILNFDVSMKVYDYTRPLWTHNSQNGAGTAQNQINVNGPLSGQPNAETGDEVTVITGLNAGQVRHITAIANPGTSSETWTLDSNLPNTPAANDLYNVQPFKLIHKFTSVSAIPVDGLYFDIQNQYKGKRFLLKVLLENMNSVTALSVPSISFLYDDLGLI